MATNERNLSLRNYGKRPSNNRIRKKFSLSMLNLFANYVLSDNQHISKQGLNNMNKMMNLLDMNDYVGEDEKIKRINFIKRGLDARINYNVNNREMILNHINGGLFINEDINVKYYDMSNEEIDFIDSNISNVLKYLNMIYYADDLINMGTKLKTGNIDVDLISDYDSLISSAYNDFRTLTPEEGGLNKFSLQPNVLENLVTHTYNTLKSKSNKLKTNMVGLNGLLKGGFEKTRVYLLLGATGGGKSLGLLNIAYQIKKANKGYVLKDPTKTPAIIYMTMENNLVESIHRLFMVATGKHDMTDYDINEVINMLKYDGNLTVDENNGNIDILIEYVPAKNIDTNYIATMINKYEEQGYEIICFIQDHIKKLKSADYVMRGDLRVDLGEIINQMKVIAADKDIPIITNSHLNRDGNRKIEEALSANRTDRVKLINRDNIGESLLMLDNADVALAIAIEETPEEKYMGFKILKSRNGVGINTNVVYQPFESKDSIRLIEDENLATPVIKYTLNDGNNMQPNTYITSSENIRLSPYCTNSMDELNNSTPSKNIYEFGD